jgi:two-component sensor histidine kinase
MVNNSKYRQQNGFTRLLIIVSFLLLVVPHLAISSPTDSTQLFLKELLRKQPDSSRIKSIIYLSNYLVRKPDAGDKQLDSANSLINSGMLLAKKIHSVRMELKCRQASLTNRLVLTKDTSGARTGYHNLISKFHQAHDFEGEAGCWKDYGTILSEFTNDYLAALNCHLKEKLLSQRIGSQYGVASASKEISKIYTKQGKLTEAAVELSNAYRYFRTAGKGIEKVSCETELASLYWKTGNTQQALYFNYEAIKTAQLIKDERWIAIASNSLGRVYFNLKMYKEALPHFERSLAATVKINAESDYSIALLTIIYDRVMLKRTNGLLQYLIEADGKMPTVKNSDRINILCAYGLVYKATGQMDEAERSFLQMMHTFDEVHKKDKVLGSNGSNFLQTYSKSIGQFYIDTHRPEKARPYYEKLLSLPNKYFSPASQSEVHFSMYQIDSASGRYVSGLKHLRSYNRIHDSLYNASSANQIAGLKARYMNEKRSKDFEILRAQQKSQAALMQATKLERNITLGGIGAVLILACLAYWAYLKKQQVNKQLENQKARIDDQNISLKSLLKEKDLLLEEKETLLVEKDWLLTEVHHRVKNNLQIITSLLNFQSSSTNKKDVLEAIKISRNRIQAISLIHLKLSNGNNLASLNMQSYVNELVQHLREIFDLPAEKVTFKTSIDPIDIDLKQAVPIGLILNEAITNCIKYAFDTGGGKIYISLKLMEDKIITLEIADNGKGFPHDFDPINTKSLGFKIMLGLTAQLKGKFEFKTQFGTHITIRFPWRTEKKFQNLNLDRITAN